MSDRHYLTNEELKTVMLKVLCDVADICEEQGFRYSLVGGTLLGAVRHKGFIPWDDDVDIAMPRPDYEAFVEYCKIHETPFKLSYVETRSKIHSSLEMKAYDPSTQIHEHHGKKDKKIGVSIDIFALDAVGNDILEIKKFMCRIKVKHWLLVASNWGHYFRSFGRPMYIEPIRLVIYWIAKFVNPKKLVDEIESEYPKYGYGKSKYLMNVSGSYGMREIFPKVWADSYDELDFENRKFSVFEKYDLYLRAIYGDYMKLPPEEKRIGHHFFDAWYIDGSNEI